MVAARGARGVEGEGRPCDPLHFWQWHHMQTSLEPASRAGLIVSSVFIWDPQIRLQAQRGDWRMC